MYAHIFSFYESDIGYKRHDCYEGIRLGSLFKVNNRWQKFSGYERRHLCDVCGNVSYSWRDYDKHKKEHTEEQHLKALWDGVDQANERMLLGNLPT